MDPALRAIKYARIPGFTVPEACAKRGIGRSRRYRTLKARGHEVRRTLGDLVNEALVPGDARQAELVEYLDRQDHARHAPEELERVFEKLAQEGPVERTDRGWHLCAEWP